MNLRINLHKKRDKFYNTNCCLFLTKPKVLYHGSIKEIEGDYFIPKKPQDLEQNLDNLHVGVYATSDKEIAIAMAIISCKGVDWSSLAFNKKPELHIKIGLIKSISIFINSQLNLLKNLVEVENNLFLLNL